MKRQNILIGVLLLTLIISAALKLLESREESKMSSFTETETFVPAKPNKK